MSTSSQGWTIEPDADWERARRALLSAGDDLLRDLELGLEVESRLAAAAAASRVAAIPTTGRYGTGLRQRIATALAVTAERVRLFGEALAHSRIELDGLTDDDLTVALAWERSEGWDHPVYGRGSVHQEGHPWLYPTVIGFVPLMRETLQRIVDSTARRIERGGL